MLVLALLMQVIIYLVGASLVLEDKATTNRKAATQQSFYTPVTNNMTTAYAPTQQNIPQTTQINNQTAQASPIDDPPITMKQHERLNAKAWMAKNAEFLITQTGKAVDEKRQRNFTIYADMMSELTNSEKKQLVLLLMEAFVTEITEACMDKNGNINCFYYQG